MALYLILLIVSFVSAFLIEKTDNKRRVSQVLFGVLWLLCAFRSSDIGVDTHNYIEIYNINSDLELYRYEFLFYFLLRLFRAWNLNPEMCQVIMSTIAYIPLYILFFRHSRDAALSIFIFLMAKNGYYFETFNIVRQSCAFPFLLLGFCDFCKSNKIKGTISLIIALGFHTSTLICLPFILFSRYVKLNFTWIVVVTSVSVAFTFVTTNVFADFYQFISRQSMLGINNYEYLDNFTEEYALTTLGLITTMLPSTLLGLYLYKKYPSYMNVRFLMYGAIFLNFIAALPISYRMTYDIIAIELLVIPLFFNNKNTGKEISKKVDLFWPLYFIYMIFMKIYGLYAYSFAEQFTPYKFFFS